MDIVNNFSILRMRKNDIEIENVNILRKNKKKYNIKYEQFFSYES